MAVLVLCEYVVICVSICYSQAIRQKHQQRAETLWLMYDSGFSQRCSFFSPALHSHSSSHRNFSLTELLGYHTHKTSDIWFASGCFWEYGEVFECFLFMCIYAGSYRIIGTLRANESKWLYKLNVTHVYSKYSRENSHLSFHKLFSYTELCYLK